MFHEVKYLDQRILDIMLENDIGELCPDCGAEVGELHDENCDVARCVHCKGQRLGCECEEDNTDVWDGHWPGVQYCYDNKLVVYDTASKRIMFDLNTAAVRMAKENI